jgi:hypothetical protein
MKTIRSASYLRVMKRTAFAPLVYGIFVGLISTDAAGQVSERDTVSNPKAVADSVAVDAVDAQDTAAVDSARLAQKAVQAELSREVAALSRTTLGSEQLIWTHEGHFNLERAGRQQVQVFWNNPKATDTPHLWQVVNGPSEDVFYLDTEQGRAATINLNSLQGSFIPASIAARAGFTGNQTHFLSKKSNAWTVYASSDSTTVWVTTVDSENLQLTLSTNKDADRARAVFEWMRLQPLESVGLPHAAQKYPILALERTDEKGTAFKFEATDWKELDEPIELDAGQLSIKDPERDLQTIAREWAAEKKAKSGHD